MASPLPSDAEHRHTSRYWVGEDRVADTTESRLYVVAAWATGLLTAAFLLVGRWEPAGRSDVTYVTSRRVDFDEPRFIVVALLALVVATVPVGRSRSGTTRARHGIRPQRTAITLGLFLILSFLWSIDRPSGAAKATEVILLGLVALLFGLVVTSNYGEQARKGFWISLLGASGLLGLMGALQVVAAGAASTNRYVVAPLGGGPNVFGRNMAVLTVALLVLALTQRVPRWLGLPAAAMAGILVILSGSRGALLALVIGIMAAVALTRPRIRTLVVTGIIGAVTLIMLAGSTTILDQAGIVLEHRLSLGNVEDQFSSSRAQPYQEGIACYTAYPIGGAGLGGFVPQSQQSTYPHNIFLEVACEGGSVGLILLLWLVVPAVALLWRVRRILDPMPVAVLAVALAAAQFSGDLYDSRGLLILGILALAPHLATDPTTLRHPEPPPAAMTEEPARSR